MRLNLTFTLFFLTSVVCAQSTARIYTSHDGLAGNQLIRVFQDSRGFIWTGGENGLSRFDGKHFVNYSIKDGLIGNQVLSITEDKQQRLWVATSNGISCLQNSRFINYNVQKGLHAQRITRIQFDASGKLWALGASKLHYLVNDSFVLCEIPDSLYKTGIHTFFVDGEKLLLGTRKGLYYRKGKTFIKVNGAGSDIPVYSICKNANGVYLLGALHMGLYQTRLDSVSKISIQPNGDFVFLVKNGREGNMLISTGGSLIVYREKILQQLVIDQSAASVLDMLEDREGNYWAATFGGLYKYTRTPVSGLPHGEGPCLDNLSASGYDKVKKRVLLGCTGNKIYTVSNDSIVPVMEKEFNMAGGIHSFYTDTDSSLWIAGSVGELVHLTPEGEIKYYTDSLFFVNTVSAMLRDHNGQLWLASEKGLLRFDGEKFYDHSQVNGRYIHTVRPLKELPDGRLVCGSSRGLHYISSNGLVAFEDSLLAEVFVYGIEARRKFLFLSTAGLGVRCYQLDERHQYKLQYSFNTKTGLASDFIDNCLLDSNDALWILYSSGISRIEHAMEAGKAVITNFNRDDGILEKTWSQASMTLDEAGMLWVASTSGLMFSNTRQSIFNKHAPEVYIHNIALFNDTSSMLPYCSGMDKNGMPLHLLLPYKHNSLQFDFIGLCFTNPDKVLYSYRLLGLDENWSNPATADKAFYHNLPPGTYTLEVKACNNSLVWQRTPASYTFTIRAPFWMTWWFKGLLILLIPVIVTLVFRQRVRKIHKQAERATLLNKQLAELEMKALRAQMNPHFIFNALNSIQQCIMSENYESAYKYLSKFSKLLRMILDVSANAYNSVERELEMIKLYLELEELRFENKFEFIIRVDIDIETDKIQIPTMLLQPYVENALWHGLMHKAGEGKLLIEIKDKEDHLLICIEDNGIGREKAMELKNQFRPDHASRGLSINRERLELFNLNKERKASVETIDLKDANGKASGTRIEISIPLNN